MFITSIIPIGRTILKDALTYLSKDKIEPGSIVSIPLRTKKGLGIVILSKDASEMKSEIKDLDFKIKKLDGKIEVKIDSSFIEASKKFAEYSATFPGAVLGCFINENIVNYLSLYTKTDSKNFETKNVFEETAIQAPIEDRLNMEKSIVRESFAQKKSVMIMLPTAFMAEKYFEEISKGIEEYSVLIHPSLSKKKLSEALKKIFSSPHPSAIVSTKEFLAISKEDLGTIIIEGEYSRFYKLDRRPFIDVREFAKFYAKEKGIKIIYADSLLRVETLNKIKSGEILEYARLSQKINHQIKILGVDMKEKKEGKKFSALSDELIEMLKFAVAHKKKVFVFALRRGISSETICRDCGTTVFCDKCSSPVSTHKGRDGNIYICHHCGHKMDTLQTCKTCGGWRLESFGIGIERINDEINALGINTIKGYRESNGSDTQTLKATNEFLKNGGVLLGTEATLEKLPPLSIDYVAIASMDSLFSLPDFRVRERIMHLLIDIKNKATECFLIQGRNLDQSVVEQGLSGDLNAFYKEEIEVRKKWGYPPFDIFIKFTITGEKIKVKDEMESLGYFFKEYNPIIFPAFIRIKRGLTVSHMLLKISKEKWPDEKLLKMIESLPFGIEVRFDPESLL
ncbi:MAG: hypothetical protein WCV55_01450 [Candidatus Paceibacterota bacterium]